MTPRTADSTRSAAAVSPRWRSISAPDRIRAVGLALFWPAYLGAEPCTGSKTAAVSPMLAPGATPSPPTSPAARSLTMSPYRFGQHQHVVQLRLLDQLHAHVVDDAVLELDPAGVLGGDLPAALQEEAVGELHDVGLVDGGDLAAAVAQRVLERVARDALRGGAGDDLDALGGIGPDPVLDPGVQVLGVLADDDQVDVRRSASRRRACVRAGRTLAYRSSARRSPTLTLRKPVADRRGDRALDARPRCGGCCR